MHKFRIGWVQILAQVIRIGCVKLQVCIQVSIQSDESHTLLHERQDSIHLMPHEKEFIKALPTTCTCPLPKKKKRKKGSTAIKIKELGRRLLVANWIWAARRMAMEWFVDNVLAALFSGWEVARRHWDLTKFARKAIKSCYWNLDAHDDWKRPSRTCQSASKGHILEITSSHVSNMNDWQLVRDVLKIDSIRWYKQIRAAMADILPPFIFSRPFI